MDFSSRGFQRNSSARPTTGTTPTTDIKSNGDKASNRTKMPFNQLQNRSGLQVLTIVLLGSGLILAIAMLFGLSITPTKETSYVNKDRYQVVALADGQAYFGKINAINDRYVELLDVYYLNDNGSSTQSANAQLIKRGCEPHQPEDRMLIYRDQVNFWENMQEDGQITKLIKEYQEKNKDKARDCSNTEQPATPQQETNSSETENNGESSSSNNQNTTTRDGTRSNPDPTATTPESTTPETTTPPTTETPQP